MDRDRRWDRTEKFYRAAVLAAGNTVSDPLRAISDAYNNGQSDEFMEPVVVGSAAEPAAPMRDGDEVICFNFRSDRMRQIVRALCDDPFEGFSVAGRARVTVTTLTVYDRTITNPAAFQPINLAGIVADALSDSGLTTFRTAETEKYAHVTYFFNGGLEEPHAGEKRSLVASQKVATYDLMPEMSAPGVTDTLCSAIDASEHDFILCNYANADMVGHSGSLPATIKAVETVDGCLARVVRSASQAGAHLLITADHGNAEYMIDEASGGPHTAHTCNKVPFVIVGEAHRRPLRSGGALSDVGPTVLSLLGVEKPLQMSGVDLRQVDAATQRGSKE
jgi:2,3-bisphosphoglycerate-independent phosphoglycerate mutase